MALSGDISSSGLSVGSDSTGIEDSLDDAQARKSALGFLCRVNADYKEIEQFLRMYPDSLLFDLEDEGHLEESLIKQMAKCTCFTQSCSGNRKRIIRALRRGFEFYQGVRLVLLEEFLPSVRRDDWDTYFLQLRYLKRDFRILQNQDSSVENQIIDAIGEINDLRYQLEIASKQDDVNRSQLFKLKCRKVKPQDYEERASLETKLEVAALRISFVEKELKLLRMEKRATKRLQHALFKKMFKGCRIHVCNASRFES